MAPAMNVRMWLHPATQRNLATLKADGANFVGPDDGEMACGEYGPGRMAEPAAILEAALALLSRDTPLKGRRALVTAGPTREPVEKLLEVVASGRLDCTVANTLELQVNNPYYPQLVEAFPHAD